MGSGGILLPLLFKTEWFEVRVFAKTLETKAFTGENPDSKRTSKVSVDSQM